MSDEPKIIYSMVRVSKYYDKKPVIENISLSYFYGAKIGVLGLNGSGKSTLLKILAGVDTKFNGETHLAPGHTVGYLPQEPELDDSKTVKDIVEEGARELVDLVREYNEMSEKFAEPMDDDEMNQLIERQGVLQEQIDAKNACDLESQLDQAMDATQN
ncbi:ATP-binding cassette domain-containing protein, partial [bacterium]|nr:ATP-binding cassette domain-containing protein [bacterium]